MRRLLRDVAEDQALGDTTTLADPTVVDGIKARYLVDATGRGVTSGRVRYTPRALDAGAASRCRRRAAPSSSTSTACCPTRPSRQHYLEAPRRDWRSFFDACGEDPVIEEVKTLLDLLDPDLQIVLLDRPAAPASTT